MVIKSFKAQTKIKLRHMEEKDKKAGKFEHLCRNWKTKWIKKCTNVIINILKGRKRWLFELKLNENHSTG